MGQGAWYSATTRVHLQTCLASSRSSRAKRAVQFADFRPCPVRPLIIVPQRSGGIPGCASPAGPYLLQVPPTAPAAPVGQAHRPGHVLCTVLRVGIQLALYYCTRERMWHAGASLQSSFRSHTRRRHTGPVWAPRVRDPRRAFTRVGMCPAAPAYPTARRARTASGKWPLRYIAPER